jgi:phosphate:Na+ symporter
MQNLSSIKIKIVQMAKTALSMWELTFKAFMEHDLDLVPQILENENKLNDLEKEVTKELVELSHTSPDKADKEMIPIYADIVGDFELIGDYCKDILERIEIKIQEKLLFSEDAVTEYSELYNKTKEALDEVVYALEKDNPALVKTVVKSSGHIDNLVDEYRRRHNDRLIKGVCSPFACNMFLNMLDFTAAVYYHTKKIAKNLLKVK